MTNSIAGAIVEDLSVSLLEAKAEGVSISAHTTKFEEAPSVDKLVEVPVVQLKAGGADPSMFETLSDSVPVLGGGEVSAQVIRLSSPVDGGTGAYIESETLKATLASGLSLRKEGDATDVTIENLLKSELSKEDRKALQDWSKNLFSKGDKNFADKGRLDRQKTLVLDDPGKIGKDFFVNEGPKFKPQDGTQTPSGDPNAGPEFDVFGTFTQTESLTQPGGLGKWGSSTLGTAASATYSIAVPGAGNQFAFSAGVFRPIQSVGSLSANPAINEEQSIDIAFSRWTQKADIFFSKVADPNVSTSDPASANVGIRVITGDGNVGGPTSPSGEALAYTYPLTTSQNPSGWYGRRGDIVMSNTGNGGSNPTLYSSGQTAFGSLHKVATHEIGHAIGIPHISNTGVTDPNVFYPVMRQGLGANFTGEVRALDTQFARALYGYKEQRDMTWGQTNDILLRNTTTGAVKIQALDGIGGSTAIAEYAIAPTITTQQWQIATVGQFDGDYGADIMWRNTATGQNLIWKMNGSGVVSSVALDPVTDQSWKAVGSGDVDLDRDSDIFWWNSSTNQVVTWYMQDEVRVGTTTLNVNTTGLSGYALADVGDLDGNMTVDLIWRNNTTGGNLVSFGTGGGNYAAPTGIAPATNNYSLGAVADYNRDGYMDILWRDAAADSSVIHYYNRGALSSAVGISGGASNIGWASV